MTDRPRGRLERWWTRARGGDLGSYRRQVVAATALLGSVAAVTLIVVVHLAFAESAVDAADRVLQVRADSVVRSAEADSSSSVLTVPTSELGPGVAVYDDQGHLVAGEVAPALADQAAALSTVDEVTTRKVGDWAELLGRPVTTTSGATGVVVVAERLDPYQDQEWDALTVAVAAGVVIVVLTTLLAAWATRRALAPVGAMARTAEDWSEHDLGRRFDLGSPTNEIRSLGHTLDGLLDRVAQAILAEQRLTSELAHEIRTPLTAIQGTAELISMRDDLDDELRQDVEDIRSSCRAMSEIVTSLLELARIQTETGGSSSCSIGEVLDAALREVERVDTIEVRYADGVDATIRLACPADLATRAVVPVVANAVRFGEHTTVTVGAGTRTVDVEVADDGPGIDPEVAPHLFEPGRSDGSGTGLGLALARRVARSIGGEVTAEQTTTPGAAFHVRLPRTHGP